MDHGAGTPFHDVLTDFERADVELVVVNRSAPSQVTDLLERAFEGQPVTVSEESASDAPDDGVILRRDGERVTTSSLEDVMSAFLMVNGDLYRTGTSGVDRHEAPSVLTELDETAFRLRGFPESNKEKLLLILISRYVERRALESGTGRLDAAFQRLSRLEDEFGTRRIYERLARTDLDVHVYGVRDSSLPAEIDATPHTGTDHAYRATWLVVYTPSGVGDGAAALVAVETAENTWSGAWTYDPDRVDRVRSSIDDAF